MKRFQNASNVIGGDWVWKQTAVSPNGGNGRFIVQRNEQCHQGSRILSHANHKERRDLYKTYCLLIVNVATNVRASPSPR